MPHWVEIFQGLMGQLRIFFMTIASMEIKLLDIVTIRFNFKLSKNFNSHGPNKLYDFLTKN